MLILSQTVSKSNSPEPLAWREIVDSEPTLLKQIVESGNFAVSFTNSFGLKRHVWRVSGGDLANINSQKVIA